MSNTKNPQTSITSDELRVLLAERLGGASGGSQGVPLSFAQQRLWFLEQLEPNSPLYNIPCVTRLKGPLKTEALEKAIQSVIERHESFRTRFASRNGAPEQYIDAQADSAIQYVDLTGASEEQLRAAVREEIKRPFHLGSVPLLRSTLYRLGPEEHVLVLNMHHIISDEWSLKILFSELAAFYNGHAGGAPVCLPELPIQYTDFALWQREWMQGENFAQQLAFWKQQLAGNPPGVELPTDFPRGLNSSSRGGYEVHLISRELGEAVKQLATREGATVFMAFLAAFEVLLHRYTQQEDLIIGTPVAGRTRMETEGLIGFFVNTLPLRTRISGSESFLHLMARVRETALGAYSHQDLPFERLVQELHPERNLGETPFVKVMFLIPTELKRAAFDGLSMQFVDLATDTSKFELTFAIQETAEGFIAGAEYKTDLFERETIRRFLQHYESLLQGIVAQPTQPLAELPLLSESERLELVRAWSPPAVQFSRGQCIHQWFETQADTTPDAIAVVCESQSLSYKELNAQSNQLASYLRKLGVERETPVALLLERSVEMVIAILGVLKAGGTYVPIDPACPGERLNFMLEDTGAPVLITSENWRGQLPLPDIRVLSLEAAQEQIRSEPTANLAPVTGDEDGAYIIYTSGSTGKPKGVLVTHHNVVRLFQQTQHWYQFSPDDVWTLFHSYTFDFSVWETWGALLYGGKLVVVPYLVSRSPAEFYELLSAEKVSVLNQTPSAFRQLLWAEEVAPRQLPLSLRYVIFGGEALELQSLRPWFERHGDEKPRLINMYGITETTVHVSYREVRRRDLADGLGSVIGVPIPDLRLYLLDEKLQPVPTGVAGEICVAGAGVARGYLNRAELTCQRFVPDPFSAGGTPGERMYRSGDLARYTAHGELEYLGRMDHQVKIRGFRVELGEIESALNQHPAIRESIVVALDGAAGKQLVAYAVPSGESPATEDLRKHLEAKLPVYMVPSSIVLMKALPLTGNGKVDRRALPAPTTDHTANTQLCTPPRNEMESTLVDIWRQLLGRSTVGIHDNFFHLGGHSLLATQLISRIAGVLKVELPVRTIFEAPTIELLAQAVAQTKPRETEVIARRARESADNPLLARLATLSEDDLNQLLDNPKLKDSAA